MKLKSILSALATTALSLGMSLSAQAHELVYTATLLGSSEVPVNSSPATGLATITIDLDLFTMRVQSTFSGLLGNVSAAHIHCCTANANSGTAGVATQTPSFTGFPTSVKAGSYDHTFDLALASSYNPNFITANGGTVSTASNALFSGLASGKAYFNIHTTSFPGGEIRGFLTAAPVPEPTGAALGLGGLAVVGLIAQKRRQQA
jgi:CHRD domain